jgi:hypothetical protein
MGMASRRVDPLGDVPADLREAMIRYGIDPDASFSRSAEGWRHGPATLDPGFEPPDPATTANDIFDWLETRTPDESPSS